MSRIERRRKLASEAKRLQKSLEEVVGIEEGSGEVRSGRGRGRKEKDSSELYMNDYTFAH